MSSSPKPLRRENQPRKTRIKNPFVHSVLIAAFGLILAGRTLAQCSPSTAMARAFRPCIISRQGPVPLPIPTATELIRRAGLILSGNTLFGTARLGGSSNGGTVFAVNTDGTDFTILHRFTIPAFDSSSGNYTNTDGAQPKSGLVLSGNT